MTIKGEVLRTDAVFDEAFWDRLLATFLRKLGQWISPIVRNIGIGASQINQKKYNRGEWKKLALNAIPADLEGTVIDNWVKNNVSLITKTNQRQIQQLETLFREAAFTGIRAKDLQDEISRIFRGARNNVNTIARDQIGKLGAQLDKFKQTEAGIKGYYWRSSRDERVRAEHVFREGKYFDWSDPPPDGHPGEAINCRCDAEPAIDRLIEGIKNEESVRIRI